MMKRRPWSMLLAGAAILLIILSLIWLTFDAVGGTTFLGDSPPPVRLDLTPDEVLEQLETAANFDTISQDFAQALEVPTNSLQVRLQPKGCSACEMKENAELDMQPIGEIAELVPESDGAWLVKDDMMCFYLLRDELWTPKSCSIWQ